MCGIYATEHYIPRNRPDVYEKCALLLFDTWDKQRGIKPELSFDAHVQAAMRSLALWLYPQQLSRQGLPRHLLIAYMKDYLLKKRFDNDEEAENAAVEFVDFCKGRAWVLTDVGSELYGFTHRTFLEYFAASQIVRENADPARLFDYLVDRLRSGGWEVVAQLALQILNKAVEDGADDFIEVLLSYCKTIVDSALHVKLLSFAAQSLTYIVPRPDVLRALTTDVIDFACSHEGDPVDGDMLGATYLLCAAQENLPLIMKYLFDHLEDRLTKNPSDMRALSIALYPERCSSLATSQGGYSVSSENGGYWQEHAKHQYARFSQFARAKRGEISWIAIYLLEHDFASVDEILDSFGVEILYSFDSDFPFHVTVLPLVLRIVLSIPSSPGESRLQSPIIDIGWEEVNAIKNSLVARRTPWFESDLSGNSDLNHEAVVMALDEWDSANESTNLGSFLFFIATLIDASLGSVARIAARIAEQRKANDDMKLAAQMIQAREVAIQRKRRSLANNSIDEQTLLDRGVDQPTAAILTQWMSDGRFRFLRVKRRRRL